MCVLIRTDFVFVYAAIPGVFGKRRRDYPIGLNVLVRCIWMLIDSSYVSGLPRSIIAIFSISSLTRTLIFAFGIHIFESDTSSPTERTYGSSGCNTVVTFAELWLQRLGSWDSGMMRDDLQ